MIGRIAGALLVAAALGACQHRGEGEPARFDSFDELEGCPIQVAARDGATWPALRWEPCKVDRTPGRGCRQMTLAGDGATPFVLDDAPEARVGSDGRVRLSFWRAANTTTPYQDFIVADVDGEVRSLLRKKGHPNDGCWIRPTDLGSDRVVFNVRGDGTTRRAKVSKRDRLLLLDASSPMPLTTPMVNDDDDVWSWRVRGRGFVAWTSRSRTLTDVSADFATRRIFFDPASDPDRLAPSSVDVVGDGVLFTVLDEQMAGIMIHDDAGTRPLVRRYGDRTQGDYNAGSDGKTLVWTHGRRGDAPGDGYSEREVMVSPWATSTAALAPRRLRSDPGGSRANPFVVGCGYAAHDGAEPTEKLIVRLSDGASWTLAAESGWTWGPALALTCDELFAKTWSPEGHIVRVRLDSLGEPKAAD